MAGKNTPLETVQKATRTTADILPFKPGSPARQLLQTMQHSQEVIGEAKSAQEKAEVLDRIFHAQFGKMTTGMSPAAIIMAYTDWATQMAFAPSKRLTLARSAWEKAAEIHMNSWEYWMSGSQCCFDISDKRFAERFRHESWSQWPFCLMASSYLRLEDWWQEATEIRGMDRNHKDLVSFLRYQWLNAFSPENYAATNPQIIEKTIETGGQNFAAGMQHFIDDRQRWLEGEKPSGTEQFRVGEKVAATPGKVVFRNRLVELIQYTPQTETVYPEPVLIIPAWIMKYYVLDLTSDHSLVKYMVDRGHTVFMVSWKNPDESYRDTGLADYLKQGVLEALDAVEAITGQHKIHATGYCIGGTLLAMAASHMARHHDDRLKSMTLFAAQTDFEEAGEMMTFIDENQLSYLEDIMYEQGYLRGNQMSAAFNLLNPKELIWSKMVQEYLLGERSSMIDLIAWNEDTTRLPYKMHSEYLRELYLENRLAEGDYKLDGETVTLEDIRAPIFLVSTEKDHIAPWKSVYKLHHFTAAPITFVLANRGHNGGIISEPGHKGRSFRIAHRKRNERYVPPEQWLKGHQSQNGSWWPRWHKWLAEHSGEKAAPPKTGNAQKGYKPLCDAPGTYVYE